MKFAQKLSKLASRIGSSVSVVDNKKNPASALNMRARKANSMEKIAPEAVRKFAQKIK